MKSTLKLIPWQVQLAGLAVGALVVVGYVASRKLRGAASAVSGAASAAVSTAQGAAQTVANPWAGGGVAALAYDPTHTYWSLLRDSLTSGNALGALGLRTYLSATGPLNADGTITQADGSRVALLFNADGAVTGVKTVSR